MFKNVWSKDGERTINMYPKHLQEITFKLNTNFSLNTHFYWSDEQKKNLFSPSRVLNLTSDKSGLERWRKKVGMKEANRIVNYSIDVGKLMHEYLERSVKKFSNYQYLNQPPMVSANRRDNAPFAVELGEIILEKGLKDKLEEVWGIENKLYFAEHFKGIVDLVGVYEGQPSIIDFKQKRSPQKKEYILDYLTQMACYGMAYNWMYKTNIRQGVLLIVTHEKKFQRYILQGREWNYFCLDFIKRLKKCIRERDTNA